MRLKKKNRGFFSSKVQNLSDKQYNALASNIKSVSLIGDNTLRITGHVNSSILSKSINDYYGRNKLNREYARELGNDRFKDVTIKFLGQSGDIPKQYADELTRVSSGGPIVAYDESNPFIGITIDGNTILLDDTSASRTRSTRENNDEEVSPVDPENEDPENENPENEDAEKLDSGGGNIMKYIIIAAVVIIAISLLNEPKKK